MRNLLVLLMLLGGSCSKPEPGQLGVEAQALLASGDFETAKLKLLQVVELDAKEGEAYFLLGKIEKAEGNKTLSLEYFLKSVEAFDLRLKSASNSSLKLNKALSLAALGRYDESFRLFQELQQSPDTATQQTLALLRIETRQDLRRVLDQVLTLPKPASSESDGRSR